MMNPYLNPPSTLNLPGAYMAAQQANMGQMQQNEYMRQLNAAQSSRNAYTDYLNQNPDASDEDKLNFAQNQTLKQGDVGGFEKMQNLKSMAAERDANAGYKKMLASYKQSQDMRNQFDALSNASQGHIIEYQNLIQSGVSPDDAWNQTRTDMQNNLKRFGDMGFKNLPSMNDIPTDAKTGIQSLNGFISTADRLRIDTGQSRLTTAGANVTKANAAQTKANANGGMTAAQKVRIQQAQNQVKLMEADPDYATLMMLPQYANQYNKEKALAAIGAGNGNAAPAPVARPSSSPFDDLLQPTR